VRFLAFSRLTARAREKYLGENPVCANSHRLCNCFFLSTRLSAENDDGDRVSIASPFARFTFASTKHTTVTMASEEPTNRLYVGNIPWSTSVEELRGIFSQCGSISLVDIPTGRQGRSRGYGIVEYSSVQEAQVAIQQLDGA
jgi:RNA recognition motif-containing protein